MPSKQKGKPQKNEKEEKEGPKSRRMQRQARKDNKKKGTAGSSIGVGTSNDQEGDSDSSDISDVPSDFDATTGRPEGLNSQGHTDTGDGDPDATPRSKSTTKPADSEISESTMFKTPDRPHPPAGQMPRSSVPSSPTKPNNSQQESTDSESLPNPELFPQVAQQTGFDSDAIPDAVQKLILKYKYVMPPQNPNDPKAVKKEKKEKRDDMEEVDDYATEKVAHSTANHSTYVNGVIKLPFDIYSCEPLIELITVSGLLFAGKFPSKDELLVLLGKKKDSYPAYRQTCLVAKEEAKKKLEAKEKLKSSPTKSDTTPKATDVKGEANISQKSIDSIWTKQAEDWFFLYPIKRPLQQPATNQRAENARKAKGKTTTTAAGAKLKSATASSSTAATARRGRKPFLEMPEVDPRELELMTGSSSGPQAPSSSGSTQAESPLLVDTNLYGTDANQLPPSICRVYSVAFKPIYTVWAAALDQLASERNELNGKLSGAAREEWASKPRPEEEGASSKEFGVNQNTEKEAWRKTFGDWAVTEVAGQLEWATYPPGAKAVVPGYKEAIKQAATSFRSTFRNRDTARFETLIQTDADCSGLLDRIDKLNMPIREWPRWLIHQYLNVFAKLESRYKSFGTSPTPRFTQASKAFFQRCHDFDLRETSDWDSLTPEQRKDQWDVLQGIKKIERDEKEFAENNEEDPSFSTYNFARAAGNGAGSSDIERMQQSDLLGDSDYGVDMFKDHDAWDIIQILGLENLHTDEQRTLANSMSRSTAHEIERDNNDKPIRVEGEWKWVYPDVHRARTEVICPGLARLDATPRDQQAWDDYIEANHVPQERSAETHAPIFPSVHQLYGAANILSRGYLDQAFASGHSHTFLQDDVGVGKTLQCFMVIGLLEHYRKHPEMSKGPHRPPVMDPWKKAWCRGKAVKVTDENGKTSTTYVDYTREEIDKMPTKWIGETKLDTHISQSNVRRGSWYTPTLVLTTPTVQQSHMAEFNRFLDLGQFAVMEYPRSSDASTLFDFVLACESKMDEGTHVIISMTFNQVTKLSQNVGVETKTMSEHQRAALRAKVSKTILKDNWFWDLVVLDEIHYLRNRVSKQSRAIQRITVKGMIAIGATATPLWNSPVDLIGEAQALRHPKVNVDLRSNTGSSVFTGIEKAWNKLSKQRAERETKNQALREAAEAKEGTKEEEAEALAKLKRDMDKMKRYARWFGEDEDADAITDLTEKENVLAMNKWRKDLKETVADPLIEHFAPYTIRRTKDSKDLHGDNVVQLPDIHLNDHVIKLSAKEAEKMKENTDRLSADYDGKAKNFQIMARKLLIEPSYVLKNWFNPTDYPSHKVRRVVKILKKWQDDNREGGPEWEGVPMAERPMKDVKDQTKLVIHTFWTSLIPVLQIRLAQYGFFTKAISGETDPRERAQAIADFQRDEPQMSDPVGWHKSQSEVMFWEPKPTRIMIITSVGTAGVNLFRASHLVCLDLFFTHQELVQVQGRIARKGQTRKCYLHTIRLSPSSDDWMSGLAGQKGLAASAIFNRGTQDLTLETTSDPEEDAGPFTLPENLTKEIAVQHEREWTQMEKKRGRKLEAKVSKKKMVVKGYQGTEGEEASGAGTSREEAGADEEEGMGDQSPSIRGAGKRPADDTTPTLSRISKRVRMGAQEGELGHESDDDGQQQQGGAEQNEDIDMDEGI